MSSEFQLPPVLLLLIPILVPAMLVCVVLGLSWLGGWRKLAKLYPQLRPPLGRKFVSESGIFGPIIYGRCMTIHISDDGLAISMTLSMRLGHPPLFIPWDATRVLRIQRFLWMEWIVLAIGSPHVATIRLPSRIVDAQYRR